MADKYLNLRFHIGDILVSEARSLYVGGNIEYAFNVDTNKLSIPEIVDYAKDFGFANVGKMYIVSSKGGSLVELRKDRDLLVLAELLSNKDTIDIYSDVVEKLRRNSFVDEDDSDIEDEDLEEDDIGNVADSDKSCSSYDEEHEADYVGIDPGFEDIDKGKKNISGKLVGDEPFYDSSDADSFKSDSTMRVFREYITRYAIERGCELEKITNDKNRVRIQCKTSGCPWLLFASREPKSVDFIIRTYNPRHNCNKTNTNSMCNTKYLAKYYRSRIIPQPCIKGWEMQDLAREDLGLYVGKKIYLKARKQVLKEVMGDNVKEFGRIYNYRYVLLQSNPGSTCVVKVTDSEDEKKLFHSFYICFAAMKREFIEGCRKCIGLDGCFLKGISKGELLVAIAKDGNNQMFPIAWAVVGTESKDIWCWFIRKLKSDLESKDTWSVNLHSVLLLFFFTVSA
ncbi:PREDICTED: uncharacterized protein LOC109220820 [Nicotiana attenuata]|uniref:uncharacterized protein LOC109220820 n=1 Tax=Nicotiana attenuata TaxID=49451 RepID=UPI000904B7D4|nr:PREDICTED: uncharacterized protein LOC109220820 [Nicotiana attenuata]